MQTKKCTVEPTPEDPLPDICKLYRLQQKEKAGIKICPKPPVEIPPPPPECLYGICIEKIKNPDFTSPSKDEPKVCVVEREMTVTSRCDEIDGALAAKPDLPWPGCPPQPTIPLPPEPDLCEIIQRRERIRECKERMKRYLE